MRFKKRYLLLLLIMALVAVMVTDHLRISNYEVMPMRPTESLGDHRNRAYFELSNGQEEIDWRGFQQELKYVEGEYDCSDFRLVNMVRILYKYEDRVPPEVLEQTKETLFNFRYWWDEPGQNSMCYWSENHQILFASAEYLIGQKYRDVTFKNDYTGQDHMDKARIRILDWLEMRWKYGFTEFYSEVYYKEDLGALINLIDFAEDEEVKTKSQIIMDLLFYDVATQSLKTTFASASGRAYFGNRKGIGKRLSNLTNYFWGNGEANTGGLTYGMITSNQYELPPVLADIARDTSNVVIKQRNGLNIADLAEEGYDGTDNRSLMMLWGMECFTNPEIIRNSMYHIRNNISFSNEFVTDFKRLDYRPVRWLKLEPTISRILQPQSDGVAIQQGHTYTYRTADYLLFAVQNYHPGSYADQQHVAGINIDGAFNVFHTHPASREEVKRQSPSYWVGYGHLPHVAQEMNINLSIYNIPEKKGMMEIDLLDYTHAFFPTALFDEVVHEGQRIFGRKANAYTALIGHSELYFKEGKDDDLIQDGKQSFWIIEAGSKRDDGSFEAFYERVRKNEVSFDTSTTTLTYSSKEQSYELQFGADFKYDGELVDTVYPRFDSPYSQAEVKPEVIDIAFNGKSLHLDFYNLKREVSNSVDYAR
ncbi:MAG: hypothetical protein AAGA85_10980 [Bacteroidota bacterium]